ncbi:MAG: beta-ketoacyl synthase N-terminal-like domain-containing protein [Desulfobacterales bacterium]
MKKTVFLYSGEGTHGSETGFRLLKHSTLWSRIEDILSRKMKVNLEQLWKREIRNHHCPYSPLFTVVSQICLAEIWQQWGYHPDVVIGHSTGEFAAAYQAGFYTLEDVLQLVSGIGEAASHLEGVMAHGKLSDAQIPRLPVTISSFNFSLENGKHVTLSGYNDEMEEFLRETPGFVRMKLPHPWHHPDYRRFFDRLAPVRSSAVAGGTFVSGVTTRFETRLDDDYWQQWMVSPIDFIQSMQSIKDRYDEFHLDFIEIGFHPVLQKCCEIFRDYSYGSSMFRGEDDINWILYQRKQFDRNVLIEKLRKTIDTFKPGLDFTTALAYQGLGSLEFAELSILLLPFFPSLAPQDFYRYKTIDQLIDRFGAGKRLEQEVKEIHRKNDVVISGMSCRLPTSVETPAQFWEMLLSKDDQVRLSADRAGSEGGYLNDVTTRFDHRYFNISPAEARAMDPQQILALELVEMLWKDAGIDPETLDKSRIGVYIGVWNQEYVGDRSSVFYPTGSNPSIIAARISYHYDLRGPSWVSNTACSSSLVAVHYATKDIEAGRVDYAIAGGVNMLLDEEFSINMRNSGFLSRDNRCKTFDDSADGYVRAEGGGLVLLVNKTLTAKYYAEVAGSAVNQNGRRAQVITAPHPEAQEELIAAACHDAGIRPQDVAYVECHGTGTKIGDPIEISAIKNTIAKDRNDACYVGSVKSNIGHLESAAGIAGLIKSVASLHHGIIPPNLHFHLANTYIDFGASNIRVVDKETEIDHRAIIGVSSFGFGGTNAHILIKGAEASVRKEIRPLEVPFDRGRSAFLDHYVRRREQASAKTALEPQREDLEEEKAVTRADIDILVGELFSQLTNSQDIDPEIELTSQGLDSLSGTELITQLESSLHVEIGPDILFEYPLREQFVDKVYALTAKGLN